MSRARTRLRAGHRHQRRIQTSIEDFRRIIEVNLMGQVRGAMATLPHDGGANGTSTKLELKRSLYPWVSEHSVVPALAAAVALRLGARALRRASSEAAVTAGLLGAAALLLAGKGALSAMHAG